MTITVGTGEYVYEYHGDWPRLPPGQTFEKPSGVAVDSHDRVYVVQKSRLHVLVFDQDGYFLDAWARPPNEQPDCHLIYISPNGVPGRPGGPPSPKVHNRWEEGDGSRHQE